MTQGMEFLEDDKFPVECLVVSFDLTPATGMIGPAEDQFDTVFLSFSFEQFRDELFTIIDVDLSGDSAGTECPLQGIDS